MKCPNCGSEIKDGYRFCPTCRTKVSDAMSASAMTKAASSVVTPPQC